MNPKISATILLACLGALNVSATGQTPDVIVINNSRYDLLSFPSLNAQGIGPVPDFAGSAASNCWRNYIATWEIRDGQLWLLSIKGKLLVKPPSQAEINSYFEKRHPNQIPSEHESRLIRIVLNSEKSRHSDATLDLLFHGMVKGNRVFANWYSGTLEIGQNGERYSTDSNRGFRYQRKVFITVSRGKVTEERIVDNPPSEWDYSVSNP